MNHSDHLLARQVQDHVTKKFDTVKNKLEEQGVAFIDTNGSGPQKADECIHKQMQEILEDVESPHKHLVVLITSDGGFRPHLIKLQQAGFGTCIMGNFDSLSSSLRDLRWLEIWSYFTVSRGDIRKIVGDKVIRGSHPTLGYTKAYPVRDFQDMINDTYQNNPFAGLTVDSEDDDDNDEQL